MIKRICATILRFTMPTNSDTDYVNRTTRFFRIWPRRSFLSWAEFADLTGSSGGAPCPHKMSYKERRSSQRQSSKSSLLKSRRSAALSGRLKEPNQSKINHLNVLFITNINLMCSRRKFFLSWSATRTEHSPPATLMACLSACSRLPRPRD